MNGIGRRLKYERIRLGFTQAQFGSVGGVATNAQAHYESGVRVPRADYFAGVAAAGADVMYVLSGGRSRPCGVALPEHERFFIESYRSLPGSGKHLIHQLLEMLCDERFVRCLMCHVQHVGSCGYDTQNAMSPD
ncbi:Cro/CI family transcriptional regulator [Pseudomonas sp. StFLB209]|uniref:helix-turn-helix domain-containing protein n=1 Tax=Pseudomonas sp. StFLB209 TaxID=1028989 RepID=UPI0004F8DE17|nr:helix-turn-helix domain-containing protein [Pseudomonas sp. StFLB209]BAP44432.1 Cro/CI family transcriptional regulator [Pseudomonas sp. StFLB209]